MEKHQSRVAGICIGVCLSLCTGLVVTMGYLELSRGTQIELLKSQINVLAAEMEWMKMQFIQCQNSTDRALEVQEEHSRQIQQLLSDELDVGEGTAKASKRLKSGVTDLYEEDEEYYEDDRFTDDYDEYEDKPSPSKPTKKNVTKPDRGRRSIEGSRPWPTSSFRVNRLIISQGPKDHPPKRNSEVQARIIIDAMRNGTGISEHVTGGTATYRPPSYYHTTPRYSYHEHGEVVVGGKPHKGKPKKAKEFEEPSLVAAHYGGDAARFKPSSPSHYDKNHRMYHPGGQIKDWEQAYWVGEMNMDQYIQFERGTVKVIDAPGIYYVYAQVFYADIHDISGFKIYVNDIAQAQCTTTSVTSGQRMIKRDSCYTGLLLYLRDGDRLSIREVEGNRYTMFEPTKSFFGLFRVASK